MKIAIVMPHIFMWDKILKESIFAPGKLAIDLADGLIERGHTVTLFTAGKVKTKSKVIPADLRGVTSELAKRKLNLTELIKQDLETFHKLFKSIELSILSNAFKCAQDFDMLHVYITNGPEGPLFSKIIHKPVLFTLHDPFKLNFPNPETYELIKEVPFTAISNNQKLHVPKLNVIKTVYNGINVKQWKFIQKPKEYYAYFGRIIKPKGVHHAINACLRTGNKLKIAGIHYEGHGGDTYWSKKVEPYIDGKQIEYRGFINSQKEKNEFLGNAKALLFPITWDEPFGMSVVEANACGTPVIAFNRGSIPEIVKNGLNGHMVGNVAGMKKAMKNIDDIDRKSCREHVEDAFSLEKMVEKYESVYKNIIH